MAGVGVPFYPFFSTTYGDGFGYNERDGSNLNTFRNRYLNSEYRGASNSGPTRFANNAKATLAHSVTPAQTVTQSAVPPLNFSRSAPLEHLNGSRPPPPPPHRYPHDDVSVYHNNNSIFQASTTSPSYAQTSRESLPLNRISPSFHHSYYYDDNRDGGDYSYSMNMKKNNEIPAQSIPFGRLNATSSLSSSSSSSRSNTLDSKQTSARSAFDISYNKPGLTFEKAESSRHYGSQSISRRLPEGERLRYQVPGYMGFVRTVQFRHGDTYGKTTRKCLLNLPDHA